MRATADNTEWDLVAYSGSDTNFWEVESPTAEEEAQANRATEGADVSTEARPATEEETDRKSVV